MTPDELRALADALDPSGKALTHPGESALQRAAAYLRACADVQPVAVPAGWKRVPVEPTPEMLSAVGMMDGYDCHAPGCSPDADHANWYSAMIAAAPAAPLAEPKRDWSVIDAAIREYLDNYELIGEDDSGADACYTPTERELYLIYDAINGLLADESFVAAISAPQAEPKREQSTRSLVIRWWQLPMGARREIALRLGLISEEEVSLPEPERYARALLRAKERNQLVQIAEEIDKLAKTGGAVHWIIGDSYAE